MILAGVLICCSVIAAPGWARASPDTCPPACDRIPGSAWPDAAALPLFDVYRWPGLAGIAVTSKQPRFRFEDVCASPPLPDDPRSYAVAAKAVVTAADGQWQLQVQVIHWRGETWRGGQLAQAALRSAANSLRACQRTAASASPSVTTDEPERLAAVIGGPVLVHQYLLADPSSSTIGEVALWAAQAPGVPPPPAWAPTPDAAVFDAMAAPLCEAYLGSCG